MLKLKCIKCSKIYKSKQQLNYHQQRNCRIIKCTDCNTIFPRQRELEKHKKKRKKTWCEDCQIMTCNHMQWNQHINSHQKVPEFMKVHDLNQIVYPRTGYENYPGFQKLLKEKASDINNKETSSLYKKVINKKIDYTFTYNELYKELIEIYEYQTNAFKVNLGFGFILFNINSNTFKYFYCSTNNLLFQHAVIISNFKELTNFMNKIINLDLPTNYYLKKPSSGWVLAGLTNIQINVYQLPDPIGNCYQTTSYTPNQSHP